MATLQQIIDQIPVGKANAMRVADFEAAIGNQPCGTNNDQTRNEVKGAIMNDHIPIGSSSGCGYWLIDSDAECQEIINRIEGTINDLKAKRDAVIDGWERRKASKTPGNPWPK